MSDETHHENNPRRGFLKRVATVSGALPFSQGLTGGAATIALIAPATAATTRASQLKEWAGYTSMSPEEAGFTEALVNVMCPADEFTPDGVACGLAVYIDRQLTGSFGKGAKRYLRGPWTEGKPQHGYQLPLTPEQYFKSGVTAVSQASERRFGKAFDQLAPADANVFLNDLATGKVVDPELNLASWFNERSIPCSSRPASRIRSTAEIRTRCSGSSSAIPACLRRTH